MKISALYNTSVRVEEGDRVAFDNMAKKLYLRVGDNLYVSSGLINNLDSLKSEIQINSAGFFSKHADLLPKDLEWITYKAK